ncbi:hypothetical protein ACFSLT_24290 [Novosphingobium resinovorum]
MEVSRTAALETRKVGIVAPLLQMSQRSINDAFASQLQLLLSV